MKKLIIILLLVTSVQLLSQTPQAFKYQTVIRDASGNPIVNQDVSFKINILKGGTSGDISYSESHFTNTNDFGLVNLEIGNGEIISGDFSSIEWWADNYFVEISIDETGGTNYQLLGTSQLLSVPYALHSSTSDQTTGLTGGGLYVPDTNKPIPINHQGQVIYILPYTVDSAEYGAFGTVTNANDYYDGRINTNILVNLLGPGDYAAYICDTLTAFGYDDWYLPAYYEMKTIINYNHLLNWNNLFSENYWTSSEVINTNPGWYSPEESAIGANIISGSAGITLDKNTIRKVICIRRD